MLEKGAPVSHLNAIRNLQNKDYRDAYLDGMTRATIAHQIHLLRSNLKMNQAQFAKKIGKPQSVVSRLENPDYGKVSILTLIEVANALDIAIIIRFCSYPEFLDASADVSAGALNAESIYESVERLKAEANAGPHPHKFDAAPPSLGVIQFSAPYQVITNIMAAGEFTIMNAAHVTPFTIAMQSASQEDRS